MDGFLTVSLPAGLTIMQRGGTGLAEQYSIPVWWAHRHDTGECANRADGGSRCGDRHQPDIFLISVVVVISWLTLRAGLLTGGGPCFFGTTDVLVGLIIGYVSYNLVLAVSC